MDKCDFRSYKCVKEYVENKILIIRTELYFSPMKYRNKTINFNILILIYIPTTIIIKLKPFCSP